ncbi:MAG TPA: GMC family oxidoreductase [Burkholderiales bacterium]|nr:GMC family oxidoreductase [Burkholderiales bacterium]
MLTDFAAAGLDARLQFDVCIIGGGIAGLTLAHALAGKALSVGVLEAGGRGLSEASQLFFDADVVGAPYAGHVQGRFRALGGSSLKWGAQLLPLHPEDFDVREHVPHSGWPVGYEVLQPYYRRALALLHVDALPFDRTLARHLPMEPLAFDESAFAWRYSKWARFRHRNVWELLGPALSRSTDVHVFYHAPVVRLRLDRDSGCVTGAAVARADGRRVEVSARTFVLCLGTLETARLMLASNDVAAAGLGNEHDNVGRYFHDHLSFRAAQLVRAAPALLRAFSPRFSRQVMHYPRLELTPAAQARYGCSAAFAHLQFEHGARSAFTAMRSVLRRLQQREWFLPRLGETVDIVTDLPYFFRLAASFACGGRVPVPPGADRYFQVDVEQAPNRDSRVLLGDQVDRLGMPRLRIDWRITERELRTAAVFVQRLAEECGRLAGGAIDWRSRELETLEVWRGHVHDTYHQAGTTRMADSPAQGVVDRHLQVHGVPNVYVAGCSVFPTGGSANPTLTMMALTLRLADRLSAAKRTP